MQVKEIYINIKKIKRYGICKKMNKISLLCGPTTPTYYISTYVSLPEKHFSFFLPFSFSTKPMHSLQNDFGNQVIGQPEIKYKKRFSRLSNKGSHRDARINPRCLKEVNKQNSPVSAAHSSHSPALFTSADYSTTPCTAKLSHSQERHLNTSPPFPHRLWQ